MWEAGDTYADSESLYGRCRFRPRLLQLGGEKACSYNHDIRLTYQIDIAVVVAVK